LNNPAEPVSWIKPFEEIPWWLEDIEEYLEFLHGDIDSLCEQHSAESTKKSRVPPSTPFNPKKCPGCKTVFHITRRGGGDICPFCRGPLNFIIA
jgi:hypothetical protein